MQGEGIVAPHAFAALVLQRQFELGIRVTGCGGFLEQGECAPIIAVDGGQIGIHIQRSRDRKSVVEGKSVDPGGRGIIKKKKEN